MGGFVLWRKVFGVWFFVVFFICNFRSSCYSLMNEPAGRGRNLRLELCLVLVTVRLVSEAEGLFFVNEGVQCLVYFSFPAFLSIPS